MRDYVVTYTHDTGIWQGPKKMVLEMIVPAKNEVLAVEKAARSLVVVCRKYQDQHWNFASVRAKNKVDEM